MSKIFTNDNQLEEWVETAEGIQDRFGIERALGYVIGEKFHNLVDRLHAAQKSVRTINEKRKKPDFNPIRMIKYKDREFVINLDKTYEDEKASVIEAEGLLIKFVFLINEVFSPHEIRKYFDSHSRSGVHGHISTEEDHGFLVTHGAIEHSLDTEIEDTLILGDMMKYFGINV